MRSNGPRTMMWSATRLGDLIVRTAGDREHPPIWFVHALGDAGSFAPLLDTVLGSSFQLFAPDLPGSGLTAANHDVKSISAAAASLVRAIVATETTPVALVGHSLGAAIAARAVLEMEGHGIGLFSIEGNLTNADAYFSGEASRFETPTEFQSYLAREISSLARTADPPRNASLWRYHASLTASDAETLWMLGRDARMAGANDALGAEYRDLTLPTLYYWSPDNTPSATQDYIRRHHIPNVSFVGGHWPMIENPEGTAAQIRSFFDRLLRARRSGDHRQGQL